MAEGEVGHVRKGAASGEEGAEPHEEDFVEEMGGAAQPAGIGDGAEVVGKTAQRGSGIKQGHALTTQADAFYNKMGGICNFETW